MSAVPNIGKLIARSARIRGGRPCIAGTGVSVRRIVGWYQLGQEPEEIVSTIGHITLAQVHAALAYYHANRDEFDEEILREEVETGRLERKMAGSRKRK